MRAFVLLLRNSRRYDFAVMAFAVRSAVCCAVMCCEVSSLAEMPWRWELGSASLSSVAWRVFCLAFLTVAADARASANEPPLRTAGLAFYSPLLCCPAARPSRRTLGRAPDAQTPRRLDADVDCR